MPAFIRRLVALLVLAAFAALCSGRVPEAAQMKLAGLPRLQAVPLLLSSLSGGVVAAGLLAGLLVLTLLFGRVYCSWLCPLGILQDIINRLLRPKGLFRPSPAPHHYMVRGFFALAAFGCLAAGSTLLLTYLDPYSICARAFGLLRPGALSVGDGAEPPWAVGLILVAFALPLGMAAWRGRLYCNTVCPVGAVLGLAARVAPFAPRIAPDACRHCGACLRRCKAQAIDTRKGHIDPSRCVGCYDCLGVCRQGALSLRLRRTSVTAAAPEPPADPQRRALVAFGAMGLASALFPLPADAEEHSGAGSPAAEGKAPVLPPGAGKNRERFLDTCTGCGLCIAHCPTGVLRPSVTAHGWKGFLKPYLAIAPADAHGLGEGRFCRFDCNRCSTLCPTGALTPLSLAEKQATRIGTARHNPGRCIPWQSGYACGHCVSACPTQALSLRAASVPVREHPEACAACRRCIRVCPQGAIALAPAPSEAQPDRQVAVIDYAKCIGCGACAAACRRHHVIRAVSVEVPHLDASRCIGCGACTAHCPATPQAAISVEAEV